MKEKIIYIIRDILGDNFVFNVKKILNFFIAFESYQDEKQLREQREIFNKNSKLFYGSFIKAGDICFDVGANVGNRVKPLLELKAEVVAIEPQKKCYDVLEKKYGSKIEIIKKGIGAKEEEKEFFLSSTSTISSFSKEWIDSVKNGRFKDQKWNKKEIVSIITLNKVIEKFGMPTFIKIDVEGFETEVIKGLSKSIPIVSYEYTVPEQIENAVKCLKLLQEIDKNVNCNYSIGESMSFVLKHWLSVEDMISHINKKEFINTGFGDIYVKQTNFNF